MIPGRGDRRHRDEDGGEGRERGRAIGSKIGAAAAARDDQVAAPASEDGRGEALGVHCI